jgi:hypothetical protein
VQHQQPRRFQLLDEEAALGFGCAVGDEVTNVKILKLFKNVVGAGAVCRKQELVDPLSGVPAAAVPAHLDQPRPHAFRASTDGDAMRDHELRLRDDVITCHTGMPLEGGRAVRLSEPMDRRVRKQKRGECPAQHVLADGGGFHRNLTLACTGLGT